MNERLEIDHFGPIEKAAIDLRDLTVFVGPQATGKSLASQSLYFLRRYETLLLQLKATPSQATAAALESWFGPEFSVYTSHGSRLYWNPGEPDEQGNEIRWTESGLSISHALEERFHQQAILEQAEIYIPAGRTLYSFLPPHSLVSRVLASQEWPGFILTFYETLGRTISWLRRKQENANAEPSRDDDPPATFLRERIETIFKGQIQYGDETIALKVNGGVLSSNSIAAGQMEIWPFWALVEAGLGSKRFDSAQIYFEEPETHLHPAAQQSVMEMIAHLVRNRTRFLITTHSPYILYCINNFLMTHKVLSAGKTLPENISAETALPPERVAAYRFAPNGLVHDIMDREIGLIDESELDDVADDLGSDFAALQDCLEA